MRIKNLEEQLVVLYALYRCGGKGRKRRIVHFIIENDLIKLREDDVERRESNEPKVVNDFAWARQDLKDQGWLSMPEHGFWEITRAGREQLLEVAKAVYGRKLEELPDFTFDRFNAKLLGELRELGQCAVHSEMPKG